MGTNAMFGGFPPTTVQQSTERSCSERSERAVVLVESSVLCPAKKVGRPFLSGFLTCTIPLLGTYGGVRTIAIPFEPIQQMFTLDSCLH